MEVELVVHKKKKKKNKKRLTVELPEAASDTHQTLGEESLHKKHKKKKKKTKDSESGDGGAAEPQTDGAERKMKKRKREGEKVHVDSVVMEDSSCQEREETKKRKKRRTEESEHPVEGQEGFPPGFLSRCGGRTTPTMETPWGPRPPGTEVTVTPVQTSCEAAGQKPVKNKSEKPTKRAETSPATGSLAQPGKAPRRAKYYELNNEAIVQEMKEYIPDIRASDKACMYNFKLYDLPRFREFKKQGIPIRTGKFTVAEKKRLKQNVKDFLALSGIESEAKLILPHRFPDEKDIRRRRRKLGFIMCLCEGIPHLSRSIRVRAKETFDPGLGGGFTDEENQDLLNLHKQHGRNWRLISEKMGRNEALLKSHFRIMCEGRGPWTEKEFRTLLTSVQPHLLKRSTPGEDGSIGSAVIKKVDLYKQLPWTAVSKQVQSRSFLYCREKWLHYLTRKLRTGTAIKGRKTLESQIQLIKAINEMVVEDVADIVWDDLTYLFGNAHPDYLKMRFHQLKVAYVPGWNTMEDFCDVIDHLYEKTLPQLEEELKNCREEEEEPTEERDSYRLSEIFPDL